MASFEFLQLIKESAYGTTKVTPVAGTDSIYIRLNGPNRFTPRPTPDIKTLMYGGGIAIPHLRVFDKVAVTGKLSVELCASQAALLLNWCATRINAGRTTPWVTTDATGVMPVGDLASVTAYHGITRNDNTIKRRKYPGGKVHKWSVKTDAESRLFMLDLDIQFAKYVGNTFDVSADPDATEFPAPADTAYPTDPYLFSHTLNGFTLDTTRTIYSEMNFNCDNAMDPRFFENHFLYLDQLRGRQATLAIKGLYKASPDDRLDYEAVGPHVASVVIDNGVVATTIQMNDANVLTEMTDDLPLEKIFEQGFLLASQWSNTAHEDISVSVV